MAVHEHGHGRGDAVSAAFFAGGKVSGTARFTSERAPTGRMNLPKRMASATHVIRFQKLVVTNLQTNEDAICRVARFIHNEDGHNFVALEFLHPAPHFWAIDFASGVVKVR